jgi:FAD/FMN-containing dehydrogenase
MITWARLSSRLRLWEKDNIKPITSLKFVINLDKSPQSIEIHQANTFRTKSCSKVSKTAAITVVAGESMYAINQEAAAQNLSIISGGAATVGLGGYLSGGGHSAISQIYGLAADNVREITVVTPTGEVVTANECLNADIFWALRGGGGATFGM